MRRACLALVAVVLGGCEDGPSLGAFSAEWAITREGVAASCASAGVASFEVESTGADGIVYLTRFPCDLVAGVTAYMPPGDYEVRQRFLDDGLTAVGAEATLPARLYPGRIVDLATVSLAAP
jgi:hypothetical protein